MQAMDKQIQFSVIIPVYNVEKYLRQCVDSVLRQTYQNIEIILVDDGSPDACPSICDEYAAKDDRICVIHKENGGLSSARNAGLMAAHGVYVIFLDSDDFYDNETFFMRLYEIVHKNACQAVFFQWKKYLEKTNESLTVRQPFLIDVLRNMSVDEKLLFLSEKDLLTDSACSKAIRRDYLIDNRLFFREGMYSEDVEWFFRFTRKLQSVELLNECCYCYRQREGSITHSIRRKNVDDVLYSVKTYAHALRNDSSLSEHKKKALLNYVAYQFFIVLGLSYSRLKGKDRKEIWKECKDYKWLATWAISGKTRKAAMVMKLFGIRGAAIILGKYIQSK